MSMTLVEELLTPKDQFLTETGVSSLFFKQIKGYDEGELKEFTYRLDKLKNKKEGQHLIDDITDSIKYLDDMMDDSVGKVVLRSLKLAAGTWAFTTITILGFSIAGALGAGAISGISGVMASLKMVSASAVFVKYGALMAAIAPILAKGSVVTGMEALQTMKKAYIAIIKETNKKIKTLEY